MSGIVAGLAGGVLAYYDADGTISEIDAYPNYGGPGAVVSNWGYNPNVIIFDGAARLAYVDVVFPRLIIINPSTGNLVAYVEGGTSSPTFDSWGATFFVGSEIWVFGAASENYIRRFTKDGVYIADATPPFLLAEYGALYLAATSDGNTFYLIGYDQTVDPPLQEPLLLRWTPGGTPTNLGSIKSILQGSYATGKGEVQWITMHNGELVVTTNNNEPPVAGVYHYHAAVVRINPTTVTQIARYEIGDRLVAGTLSSFHPRVASDSELLYTVCSDGTNIWVGDNGVPSTGRGWGEIWRINTSTGVIDLWNTDVLPDDASDVPAPGQHSADAGNTAWRVAGILPVGFGAPRATVPTYRFWPLPTPVNLTGLVSNSRVHFWRPRST